MHGQKTRYLSLSTNVTATDWEKSEVVSSGNRVLHYVVPSSERTKCI